MEQKKWLPRISKPSYYNLDRISDIAFAGTCF